MNYRAVNNLTATAAFVKEYFSKAGGWLYPASGRMRTITTPWGGTFTSKRSL
jgi:hypothetical protein